MTQLNVIANEMLPVYETSTGEKVVIARELHEQLLSKQKFTDWIQRRIENYGFMEGEDFFITLGKSTGGRPSKEFIFTLDTGKEIAMLENNEIGRAIRKYFIDVEKRFKQSHPQSQLEMLQVMINQMVEGEKKAAIQEKKLDALENSVNIITHQMTAVPEHAKVVDLINEYARYTRMGHNEIYNGIYKILKAQHGIDVKTRVENERRKINAEYYERTGKLYADSTLKKKVNGIDVMVRMGCLDKYHNILVGMLAKAKGVPS